MVGIPLDFDAADYLFLLDPGLGITTVEQAVDYYTGGGGSNLPYTYTLPPKFDTDIYIAWSVRNANGVCDLRTAVCAWLADPTTGPESYSVPVDFNDVLYKILYPDAVAFDTPKKAYIDYLLRCSSDLRRPIYAASNIVTTWTISGLKTSQWTSVEGGGGVTYSCNVGVGGVVRPLYAVDVSGDVNLTGQLLSNGVPYVASQWTSLEGGIFFGCNIGIGRSFDASGKFALDVSGGVRVTGPVVIGPGSLTDPVALHVTGDLRVDGTAVVGNLTDSCGNTFLRAAEALWREGGSTLLFDPDFGGDPVAGARTSCRYVQIGTLVIAEIATVFQAPPPALAGPWRWTLPVQARAPLLSEAIVGSVKLTTAWATYTASAELHAGSVVCGSLPMAPAPFGALDFEWNVGDTVVFSLSYEAGSASVDLPPPLSPLTVDTSGNLFLDGRLQFLAAASLQASQYSVLWTSGSDADANPAVGDGILDARYSQTGCTVALYVRMAAGSATSFGVGPWFFSAPLPASRTRDAAAWARDASGTLFPVLTTICGNVVFVQASALAPFAWAAGCVLDLDMAYEVSTFPLVSPAVSALLQADDSGVAITGLLRATTLAGVGSNITEVDSRNITWSPASVPYSALATGEVLSHFSDDRLKTRVATLTGALEKVESMTAFTYVHNDMARAYGFKNPRQRVGLSAQDVERVVPEAVSIAPFDAEIVDGHVTSRSGKNFMTVQYTAVVPVLIAALQEEAKHRRELEARLEVLEKNVQMHE